MRLTRWVSCAAIGSALAVALTAVPADATTGTTATTATCPAPGDSNYWQDARASSDTQTFWQIYFWSCVDTPVSVRFGVSDGQPTECQTVAPFGVVNWGVYTRPDQHPTSWELC